MVSIGIERAATADEMQDFKQIGNPDAVVLFLKQLSKKQQEYHAEYKPFDEACARLDYEQEINRISTELKSGVDPSKVKFRNLDLDKYGSSDWFEFIDEQPVREDKLIDSMRQSVVTGVYRNYKCKARDHGFSVYIPNEVLEAEKTAAKTKK